MIDTRALQRTLFRMQLDAKFAALVFERDATSLASTGLSAEDLEWIFKADPVGIRADPQGRRLSQLLGNVVGEFTSVVHLAVERLGLDDVVLGFASSSEFHVAIRFDYSLPTVFADYIERRLKDVDDQVVHAISLFERTLVAARRKLRECPDLKTEQVSLAPRARLLELPEGTLDMHNRLGASPESVNSAQLTLGSGREVLLLTSNAASRSGGLFPVDVEVLSESVAAVLRATESPLDWSGQRNLAEERGFEVSELREFLKSLIADGVLQSADDELMGL
ncbi:MAG: hypothetical protein ACI8TQ_003404 [Planctomycetota bacterium]|jgi:hypothetical protein